MSVGWFRREKEGIQTDTKDKKETPEGLWHKCPKCKVIVSLEDHKANLYVCNNCGHHDRINAKEYFEILFDESLFKELDANMESSDPLNFVDTKKYTDRLEDSKNKTGLKDAITTGYGKMEGHRVVIAAMNFNFIGGSMGSVVGEKISRAIDHSIKHKKPFIMVSKSGGARMMEAAYSLMQLAKVSAKLSVLANKKIPYISVLTDPTTGGVTASFAMLGDINIAEPNALIGFAGPRIVKETIGKDLPDGFQRAEFLLEHGSIDMIVERNHMKKTLSDLLTMFLSNDEIVA